LEERWVIKIDVFVEIFEIVGLNKGFAKVQFEYRIRQEKNGNRRSCFAFYRPKGTDGKKATKGLLKWKNGDD